MMVPSSVYKGLRKTRALGAELWRDCLRINYEPNVDIRTVKARIEGESLSEVLQDAVSGNIEILCETSRYDRRS